MGSSSPYVVHGFPDRVVIGKSAIPADRRGQGAQTSPLLEPPLPVAVGNTFHYTIAIRGPSGGPGCQKFNKNPTSEAGVSFQFSTWRSREARGRRSPRWTRSEAEFWPWDCPTRHHSEVEYPMPAEGGQCRPRAADAGRPHPDSQIFSKIFSQMVRKSLEKPI